MREIRGIVIDNPKGVKRVRLLTRGDRGDDYDWQVFPTTLPLKQGQIKKVIADHFKIPPGQIKWPPHVKIPGE